MTLWRSSQRGQTRRQEGKRIASRKTRMRLLFVLMSIGIVLSWSGQTVGKPTIKSSSAPTNNTHVRTKQCSGPLNDSDCIWDANVDKLKVDITVEASKGKINSVTQKIGDGAATNIPTTPPLPATPVSGTASFGPAGESMTCPTTPGTVDTKTISITVTATQTEGDTKTSSEKYDFEFRCYRCTGEKGTKTDGNGNTSVPEDSESQDVRIEFDVLNLDTAQNTINLSLFSTQPWDIQPEIPSSITLDWGEDSLFSLVVTVPGGTPIGTVDGIVLFAEIPGWPSSRSSDTVRIRITPEVDDYIQRGEDITFAWYRDGQMLEDVAWGYDFAVIGDMNTIRRTHTGLLDFRETYPEYDDFALYFRFYYPFEANGWRQTITSTNGVSDVYAYNDPGTPLGGDWMIPDLIPGTPDDFDTIYTAVDMSLYCQNNPAGFADGEWESGQTLSDLQVDIIGGQSDGCEGIYWAVSEFIVGGDRGDVPDPIGGREDLLNTAEYPTHLLIAAAHSSRVPAWLFGCCDIPGDANDDKEINIGDIVFTLNYVFKGGQEPSCFNKGDVNSDCTYNVVDAVYLVNFVFKSGPAPACGCID